MVIIGQILFQFKISNHFPDFTYEYIGFHRFSGENLYDAVFYSLFIIIVLVLQRASVRFYKNISSQGKGALLDYEAEGKYQKIKWYFSHFFELNQTRVSQ